MSSKYIDFETKTSVHVTLMRDSHSELRIKLLKRSLSMQRVFRELTDMIVAGDPYMEKMLDRLEDEKRERASKKFSSTDAESIYRIIEKEME